MMSTSPTKSSEVVRFLLLWPRLDVHIEYAWEEPSYAHFLERLEAFARVGWFDKRGTGLSDKVRDLPTLEQRVDDIGQ